MLKLLIYSNCIVGVYQCLFPVRLPRDVLTPAVFRQWLPADIVRRLIQGYQISNHPWYLPCLLLVSSVQLRPYMETTKYRQLTNRCDINWSYCYWNEFRSVFCFYLAEQSRQFKTLSTANTYSKFKIAKENYGRCALYKLLRKLWCIANAWNWASLVYHSITYNIYLRLVTIWITMQKPYLHTLCLYSVVSYCLLCWCMT